ncbi:MAG: RecX family transcriptional regulator [Bacteroidales bacterium]|jgi:regulatory protein|nr:RecX family transcriptional regulator [Bacteroidales bacterium]
MTEVKLTENDLPYAEKAEHYCAMEEHCTSAVRAKLLTWGASREQVDRITDYLVQNDYINEPRYARQYCDSKLRMQKWGRIKMAYHLRAKQLPKPVIETAIEGLDEVLYSSVLRELAEGKWEQLKGEENPMKRKGKLVTFLASKGFEMDEIQETIQSLTNIDIKA